MSKNLVIVESPAKAKTIGKFLGDDFEVLSSFGHIRDLPPSKMSIDIEHGFEPTYEISKEKTKVVSELRKAAQGKTVWLATDEDREGEAIAWHLAIALKVDEKTTKRIAFHEITKPAILAAIEHPRTIDQHLVDAQQARRVLDRLVGYELSPVLWRKVRTGLSAGRVQSVSVRLIVDREREIEAFQISSHFKITAEFLLDKGKILKAELPKKFQTEKEARDFLERIKNAEFVIEDIEKKSGVKSPSAPFTTSTLQQEASRKLSYSVSRTMVLAQKLYEAGKITYMRTDSLNLSDLAVSQAAREIETAFGKEFVKTRQFRTKTLGAQEAHEAIRPTDFALQDFKGNRDEARLYDLIWKRAIASQMAEAQLEKTVVTISVSTVPEKFIAEGEVLKFEGFLKVYLEDSDDEKEEEDSKIIPPLHKGQALKFNLAQARQSFQRPPSRYTEASLVKKMEEMGIGRPSTYAPTISTILDRGYIEKKDTEGMERHYTVLLLQNANVSKETRSEITGAERSKLFPTEIGEIVNDFLVKHFSHVVDYHFTATVEEEFDQIADGKIKWNKMISEFYDPFHKTVQESASVSREEALQVRELGIDPKTNKPVYAKLGKYGPMVQLGDSEDESEKPKFAPLMKDQKLDSLTLDEALQLLQLPRYLGTSPSGDEVSVQIGRFGPYIKCGKFFVSIPQDQLFSLSLTEAFERIEEKKKKDAEKTIHDFGDIGIKVLNGRFGPYITDGKKNAKIPKDTEPKSLTLEECQKLLEAAPARTGKRRFFARKKM